MSNAEWTELHYQSGTFHYGLTVNADGSGKFVASLDCVMATPEPGKLSCQHLEGVLSSEEVKKLAGELRKFPWKEMEPCDSGRGGPSLTLVSSDGNATVFGGPRLKGAFAVLEGASPGRVRKSLIAQREKQRRALHK